MNLTSAIIDKLNKLSYSIDQNTDTSKFERLKFYALPGVIISLFLAMALHIMYSYLGIELWRHDAFVYEPHENWYYGNLKETGRWIIYFLFDFSTWIPVKAAAIINLICLFLFGYIIAIKISKDVALSLGFAFSILLSPLLHLQNLWPQTSLTAFLFLPIVAILSKMIRPYLVYFISAIVFFGTLSNFYFLIPLLFLRDVFSRDGQNSKETIFHFAKSFLVPYILCFVIGYLITNGITYMITGESIVIGEWRKPNPINSIGQFFANFSSVNNSAFSLLTKIGSQIFAAVGALMVITYLLASSKKNIWISLVLLIVFLSPFYTTIYHGILISERTMMTSAVSLIALLFLIPSIKISKNFLHLILCLAFIFPLYRSSHKQLKLFDKIGGYYHKQMSDLVSTYPFDRDSDIYLLIEKREVIQINNKIAKHYTSKFNWGEPLGRIERTLVPALKAQGFSKFYTGFDKNIIENIKKEVAGNSKGKQFVMVIMPDKPNTYGIVINERALDLTLLEKI